MERASARIKKKLASGAFPVPSSALGVTGVFPVPEFGVAGANTRLQPIILPPSSVFRENYSISKKPVVTRYIKRL